jgi:hypothetical protein
MHNSIASANEQNITSYELQAGGKRVKGSEQMHKLKHNPWI